MAPPVLKTLASLSLYPFRRQCSRRPALFQDLVRCVLFDFRRRRSDDAADAAQPFRILGVETSCDDTGVAIVDSHGAVLAEALYPQGPFHAMLGGVLPPVARDLHAQNVDRAIDDCFRESGLSPGELTAVAVTVKPGLKLTLDVGVSAARRLAAAHSLPLLPIHHMEAHALTARLARPDLAFPFLSLLVSGGHCILAFVKGVRDFRLFGTTLDDAPGEALDKISRRLKLSNVDAYRGVSGGAAIELAALSGDAASFPPPGMLLDRRDCNFSFSGIKSWARRCILEEEERWGIQGGDVLPTASNIAAATQIAVAKHLVVRVARALRFCEGRGLWFLNEDDDDSPLHPRRLVVSGGVASNAFLRAALARVAAAHDADLVCPPARLCTDNGVMIAWNGVERWRAADGNLSGVALVGAAEMATVETEMRSPLGLDESMEVAGARVKVSANDVDEMLGEGTRNARAEQ